MGRFILLITFTFVMFAVATYIFHRFTKRRLIKYLPAAVSLIWALYSFYLSRTVHNGFEDLARLLMAMILFAGFASGLVTGLFLDYVIPRFKR